MRQRTDSDQPGAESRVSNGQRQRGVGIPDLGLDKSDGMFCCHHCAVHLGVPEKRGRA